MDSNSLYIGVDIGGTNLRVALVDDNGKVIKKLKRPSAEDILSELESAIDEIVTEGVKGIGLGIAGVINRNTYKIERSPNLHQVEGKDFIGSISKKFSVPVRIDNDANVAALGERWVGAGRRFKNFVLLTLGTGIGGGVVYGGKLLKVAAELGHITVEAEGSNCLCGNKGCLESYTSGRAIVSQVVESLEKGVDSILKECCEGNIYKITPEDVYNYALEGDTLAREALKTAGRYLGIGIASLVNIFSPEAVIIGGGLIGAWNILVEEGIKEARKRAFPELIMDVEILPAELGDNAGVVGAAYMIKQELEGL